MPHMKGLGRSDAPPKMRLSTRIDPEGMAKVKPCAETGGLACFAIARSAFLRGLPLELEARRARSCRGIAAGRAACCASAENP